MHFTQREIHHSACSILCVVRDSCRVGVDVLFPPGNPQDFIKVWTVQTLVHPGLSYPSVSDGKQNPGSHSRLSLTALLSSDSLLSMDCFFLLQHSYIFLLLCTKTACPRGFGAAFQGLDLASWFQEGEILMMRHLSKYCASNFSALCVCPFPVFNMTVLPCPEMFFPVWCETPLAGSESWPRPRPAFLGWKHRLWVRPYPPASVLDLTDAFWVGANPCSHIQTSGVNVETRRAEPVLAAE